MQLKTFDEILLDICDAFDTLIAPKSISRSNTNIIYLMFKAIAKGFEVINNVCVTLSNKFNPSSCSVEDLESVASIVGTERLRGSESGLQIIITNNEDTPVTLFAGMYYYKLDDDTTFYFELLENTEVNANSYIDIIAMSEKMGEYPVTAQTDIVITSDKSIPSALSFSCTDNGALLGTKPETDLDFRKRILTGVKNQDTIVELENTLRNLPYIFDCKCKFNQTSNSVTYDGYIIPSFELAIFFSGMPRNEIAKVIASKIICPTVATENSKKVFFYSDVFVNGYHEINLIPFKETLFDVVVTYKADIQFVDIDNAKQQIRTALNTALTGSIHKDYIKEDDIYNIVEGLDIPAFDILGIDLVYNGETVNYINVPISRIPRLSTVTFTQE